MQERIEALESKQELQDVSLAAVMNEFKCLRAHVDLLETRMRVVGLHHGRHVGQDGKTPFDAAQEDNKDAEEAEGEAEEGAVHDLTKGELREMDEAAERYSLSATVWETPVFVSCPVLSMGASVMTFFSLVLTIILQLIMIASIITFGAEFEMNSIVDDVTLWRVSEGHSSHMAHPITQASLTSRVCAGDGTLSVGMEQRDMYDSMESFGQSTAGVPRGPLLALGVLFVWSLYIVVEWSAIRELTIAFLSVPREKRTHISLDGPENCKLNAICPERLAWVLIVNIVRFGITTALGMMGTYWQIRTKSMENLVLNASALAFVMLDIPALMYSVLVPCKAKALCETMDPLPRRPRKRIHGFELLMLFDIVCIATYVGFCGAILGVGQNIMKDAIAALCGGPQNFIYGKDTFGQLLVAESAPANESLELNNAFEVTHIRGIVDGHRAVGDYDSHKVKSDLVFPISAYPDLLGYRCRDGVLDAAWVNGQSGSLTCAQAAGYCLRSPIVRLHCPETCECDDPFSGMPFTAPSYGCPRSVCQSTNKYRNAFNGRTCQDLNPSFLAGNQSWLLLWDNLYTSLSATYGSDSVYQRIRNTAKADGCAVFQAIGFEEMVMQRFRERDRVNLCDPLAAWCPVSCNCDLYNEAHCPTSC